MHRYPLMRYFLCAAALMLMLAPTAAFAQSAPNLVTGQVPTAAQWNSYFAAKQDYNPNFGCAFSPCVPPIATTPNSILETNTSGTPSFSTLLPSGMTYPNPQFSGTTAGGILSGNFSLSTSGQAQITNTTPSTSPTTGAATIAGGLGVGGALNVGGNLTVGGNLNVPAPNESANTVYAGPSSGSPAAPSFRPLAQADLPNVTPSGGTTASSLPTILGRVPNILDYGAKCDGTTDDTAAFNAAATQAAGGVFTVPGGKRCLVAGAVTIPANTTLNCLETGPTGLPTALTTIPAILAETSGGFVAGGPNVMITHCNIINPALSYPITTSPTSSWGGIAINDNGQSELSATHDTIVGYDTAVYATGSREDVHDVYADCTGVTHACIDVEHGNTDSGRVTNIKLQPIASVNTCAAGLRPGTGLRIGDAASGLQGISDFLDLDVSQNFMQTDYDFQAGVAGGTIWADDLHACSSEPTYAINVETGAQVDIATIYAFAATTGVFVANTALLHAGFLYINLINTTGNCLDVVGNVHAGISELIGCGSAAVGYPTGGSKTTSFAVFHDLYMFGVHGGAAPYIVSGIGALSFGKYAQANFSADNLYDDLGSTNLFDNNFSASIGGGRLTRLMLAPVTISSCGSNPSIISTATDNVGSIRPASGTTSCTITFNPAWVNLPNCFLQSMGISPSLPLIISSLSNTTLTISTSTAFNGTDYFSYECKE